jgi:hypothetical protein
LVAQRLERRRLLLDGSDRRWVLLQAEGALRWNFAGAEVMAAQLDHIAQVVRASERIRVGIIPAMRLTPAQPLTGFHIYDFAERKYRRDLRMGIVGTHSGTAVLGEAEVNRTYLPLFELLASSAVYDDGAHELLGRIADDHRRAAVDFAADLGQVTAAHPDQ